jgi:hypothetical protein
MQVKRFARGAVQRRRFAANPRLADDLPRTATTPPATQRWPQTAKAKTRQTRLPRANALRLQAIDWLRADLLAGQHAFDFGPPQRDSSSCRP